MPSNDNYDLTISPHAEIGVLGLPQVKGKRVVNFGDLAALSERHYGPGPHPGTGTPQEVHGGKRVSASGPDWSPERVYEKIEEWESRQEPGLGIPERGLIVTSDRDYQVLEGSINRLNISAYWQEKITETESFKVLTHTHPNNVPLSAEDLAAAMVMDLDEVRAVTPTAIHRVVLKREIPEDRQIELYAKIAAGIVSAIRESEQERYTAESDGMHSGTAVAVYAGFDIEDAWADMESEFEEIELYERIDR